MYRGWVHLASCAGIERALVYALVRLKLIVLPRAMSPGSLACFIAILAQMRWALLRWGMLQISSQP